MGSPSNISGSASEMNQKVQKAAGRRTQGHADKLDYQTAVNLVATNAIQRAKTFSQMNRQPQLENLKGTESASSEDDVLNEKYFSLEGNHYILRFTPRCKPKLFYSGSRSTNRGKKSSMFRENCLSTWDHADSKIAKAIVRYASESLKEHKKLFKVSEPNFDLPVFTKIDKIAKDEEDLRFFVRCDPYCVYKNSVFARNDWLFFSWNITNSPGMNGNEEVSLPKIKVPSKVLCVLGFDERAHFLYKSSQPSKGFCLLHSLNAQPNTYYDHINEGWTEIDQQHPASRLLFKGGLEMTKTRGKSTNIPVVHCVPLRAIVGQAIVIQDFDPVFEEKGTTIRRMLQPKDPGHEHIIIRYRRDWSTVFQAMATNQFGKELRVNPVWNFIES